MTDWNSDVSARFWGASYGGAWFKTPYDEEWIAELKASVPYRHRHWSRSAKMWWVSKNYQRVAVQITARIFGTCVAGDTVRFQEPPAPPHASSTGQQRSASGGKQRARPESFGFGFGTGDRDFQALHLHPSAPPAVVKAAYRALCHMYHPDRGGDASAMAEVNSAYERLKQKLAI